MKRIAWLIAVGLIVSGCGPCFAKAYRLRMVLEDGSIGRGTATCIGETDDGFSLFATAKHNFEGAISAEIVTREWTARTKEVVRHDKEDCAVFTIVRSGCEATDLAEPQLGETAFIDGYGPEYHSTDLAENCRFTGTVEENHVAGHDGLHPITGDSGGPVAVKRNAQFRIIGVVSGYAPIPTEYLKSRYAYRERRLQTIYTPTLHIRQCLQRRWQYQGCPPGGCPIYVRPQVQQPMIGIGIPAGPPRVVGIAEPVPQTYVPRQSVPVSPDAIRQAVADYLNANPERFRGPKGEPGSNGRSVSKADAAEIITQWLDANRDQLRGPAGKDCEEKETASSDLEERLARLEKQKLRMMVVDGATKNVLDDESYAPGEPVIFDIRRLRGSPDATK
jgi:hypothetical protein